MGILDRFRKPRIQDVRAELLDGIEGDNDNQNQYQDSTQSGGSGNQGRVEDQIKQYVKKVPTPELLRTGKSLYEHTIETSKIDGLDYNAKGYNKVPFTNYAIARPDNTAIMIREIESDIDGLKRYLLITNMHQIPTPENTRTVYSEGIDFKRMTTDLEYLQVLRTQLLAEERLQAKEADAQRKGAKGAYIGSIGMREGKYRKIGQDAGEHPVDVNTKIAEIQERNRESGSRNGQERTDEASRRARKEEPDGYGE